MNEVIYLNHINSMNVINKNFLRKFLFSQWRQTLQGLRSYAVRFAAAGFRYFIDMYAAVLDGSLYHFQISFEPFSSPVTFKNKCQEELEQADSNIWLQSNVTNAHDISHEWQGISLFWLLYYTLPSAGRDFLDGLSRNQHICAGMVENVIDFSHISLRPHFSTSRKHRIEGCQDSPPVPCSN